MKKLITSAKDKELRLKVEEFTYCKEATDEAMQFISDLLVAERQRVIEEAVTKIEQLPAVEWIHGIDEYVDRQEVIDSLQPTKGEK